MSDSSPIALVAIQRSSGERKRKKEKRKEELIERGS